MGKKIHKNFILIFLFYIAFMNISFGQLIKINKPNAICESDIYKDENGIRYSKLISVQFNEKVFDLKGGKLNAKISDPKTSNLQVYLSKLKQRYGNFSLVKTIPQAEWGDTIRVNKRTGQTVSIRDLSQAFKIKFDSIVPIDSILSDLRKLPFIKGADEPMQIISTDEPNDSLYSAGNQGELIRIDAPKAWGITKGINTVHISIHDEFDTTGTIPVHQDLADKIYYRYRCANGNLLSGKHGQQVAGFAGARTHNSHGVASIGWNTTLLFNSNNPFLAASQIRDAVDHGADIINFSWIVQSVNVPVRDEIYNALKQGIICVAGCGNDTTKVYPIPSIVYPAAYNFGSDGQVIAISATQFQNNQETWITGYNFSVHNDPINDPTNSFTDFAGPGGPLYALDITSSTTYVGDHWGTSFSTPIVSGVISLILAVDSTLTPNQIYDVLKNTAEKIGTNDYNYVNNTWSPRMGYGRI